MGRKTADKFRIDRMALKNVEREYRRLKGEPKYSPPSSTTMWNARRGEKVSVDTILNIALALNVTSSSLIHRDDLESFLSVCSDEATTNVEQVFSRTGQQAVECRGPWDVDIDFNGHFYGRDNDLKALRTRFQTRPRIVLTGPSGVGKTLLAVRFARQEWEAGRLPGGVMFLECKDGVAKAFNRLSEKRSAALLEMQERTDALLIVDDIRREQELELNQPVFGSTVPLTYSCKILMTNWGQSVPDSFEQHPLSKLEDEAARRFLLRHRPDITENQSPKSWSDAMDLCHWAGYMTILLVVAGQWLRAQKLKSPKEFLTLWQQNSSPNFSGLQADQLDTRHSPDPLASLEAPWSCLDDDARVVLRLVGRMPDLALPLARLRRLLPWTKNRFDAALLQISDRYALAEIQNEKLHIHTQVHRFLEEKARGAASTEAVECFRHLVNGYGGRIVEFADECVARGPMAVLEDLAFASALVSAGGDHTEFARTEVLRSSLDSFLQHEGIKIREFLNSRTDKRTFILQQLHSWAVDMNEGRLAEAALEILHASDWFLHQRGHWRYNSPELTSSIQAGEHNINSVAVSGDGKLCVSASEDGRVILWDLVQQRMVREFAGHSAAVWSACLSDDGKTAMTASDDRTVRRWNLNETSSHDVFRDTTQRAWVNVVAMDSRARFAISGADDGSITVWDLRNGSKVETIEQRDCHTGWVLAIAIHASGRFVSGSQDGVIRVWQLDLDSGRITAAVPAALKGHTSWVRGLVLTPCGKYVISASNDCTLKIWDLQTGTLLRTLEGHHGSVRGVAFAETSSGAIIVSGSNDETLKVWDFESGRVLHTLSGHRNLVRSVVTTRLRGQIVAVSASCDRTLGIWDLSNVDWSINNKSPAVESISIETNGTARVQHADGRSIIVEMKGGKSPVVVQSAQKGSRRRRNTTCPVRLNPRLDGSIQILDSSSNSVCGVLTGHNPGVTHARASIDARFGVSVSDDHTLRLWDLKNCHELAMVVLSAPMTAIALASNQRELLAGNVLGNVYWFSIDGNKLGY